MTPEQLLQVESEALRQHASHHKLAAIIGGGAILLVAAVPYAIVKDSGATVKDLGQEIWDGTADARHRFVNGFTGFFDAVYEDLSSRRPFRKAPTRSMLQERSRAFSQFLSAIGEGER